MRPTDLSIKKHFEDQRREKEKKLIQKDSNKFKLRMQLRNGLMGT
jgi:hypothetical protein